MDYKEIKENIELIMKKAIKAGDPIGLKKAAEEVIDIYKDVLENKSGENILSEQEKLTLEENIEKLEIFLKQDISEI